MVYKIHTFAKFSVFGNFLLAFYRKTCKISSFFLAGTILIL